MSSQRTSEGGIDQLTQDVSDMNLSSGKDGLDGDWDVAAIKNTTTDGVLGGSQLNTVKDDVKEDDNILDSSTDAEDGNDTDTSAEDIFDGFVSDGFDSDECCHESQKNHRMLKVFFKSLDELTLDEINSPVRQWHCPVCQGGPGAIHWFRGIRTLITHAKTKGSIRPRLHRGFLELLEEELHRKFGSVVPVEGSLSNVEGSRKGEEEKDIVWPAMVVVMKSTPDNCNDKGMGVQELLDHFSSYAAVKARHLYGSQGHLGMSLLIFESSTLGYMEAERLHKHFLENGTGREAYEQQSKLSYEGGRDQLYGYLATKDDVELFNQHTRGKQRVKYELISYSEVVSKLKQMVEDSQKLIQLKKKADEEKKCLEKLDESLSFMTENLKRGLDEIHIVEQMAKFYHREDQGQMDRKGEELSLSATSEKDHKLRAEEVERTIMSQDQERSQFVLERNDLAMAHAEMKNECLKRCLYKLLEIEKGFNGALKALKENHSSGITEGDTSSAAIP